MIRMLGPEVIIVEEAAEVLEASIVASFTASTKHVILIGDHLQLRPQVSEYSIGVHNGLEVSLFERLIRQGHKYVTLTTQWRMHPQISALITPSIYKTLEDAPSVSLYPPVSGIKDRLFFISHTEPEDGLDSAWGGENKSDSSRKLRGSRPIDIVGNERSKTNSHEVNISKYLAS
jgi:superfamily I DNA and/or RNA helicase